MSILVIVVSPTKVSTIKSFLGKGYKVVASKGHIRDLPKSKFGVDIENGFEPQYINIRGKGDLIKELKKEAKKADKVLLATDPDREGEAISWHLSAALGLDSDKVKRISFNEITKSTLKEAINHPRDIDENLVNAQQARRILDRIVGYKLSPFLWKKIKNGLSAGRVQSVATRIIVEREKEIRDFIPKEYWNISATLKNQNGEPLTAKYYGDKDKKREINNGEDAKRIVEQCENGIFNVCEVKKSVTYRKPQAPYTTSTMQQDANRRFGFRAQRTMMVAQELYEGINLGERSSHGLITYMRTDSLRISDEARENAKNYIISTYGESYYPSTPNIYKVKKSSQDAHEAIRPTDVTLHPDSIKSKLSPDQYKIYKMIWQRFVASQMKAADFDTIQYKFECNGNIFSSGGYVIKFPGYLTIYGAEKDVEEADNGDMTNGKLPSLSEKDVLNATKISSEQKFTEPPLRYTDGTLTKVLAEMGVGRPSTFVPTITTIISRGYVERTGKFLKPTNIGEITVDLMMKAFSNVIDYNYTAQMEESLEDICSGNADYKKVLQEFYDDFISQLHGAEKTLGTERIDIPTVATDIICEKCGATMIEKSGRFGKFAACPNYPACKNTKKLTKAGEKEKLPEVSDKKCPKCGSDMILRNGSYGAFYACSKYPECKSTIACFKEAGVDCPLCGKKIIIKTGKSKRTFYSCENYPNCTFSSWDVPTNRKCPSCGSIILKKKSKELYYCSKQCGWKE